MTRLHDYIKEHTNIGSLTSLSFIGTGISLKFTTVLTMLIKILTIFSLTIGGIVGLITIYTFLEKKNLLPKFLQRKDYNQNDNIK